MRRTLLTAAILAACTVNGAPSHADAVSARPVLSERLASVPGKTITMMRVTIAPGGASEPHRHAGSVAVYVLAGSVRSKLNDGPIRLFHAGDTFFEPEGALHALAENPSASEPTELLAVFIADTGAVLTRAAK